MQSHNMLPAQANQQDLAAASHSDVLHYFQPIYQVANQVPGNPAAGSCIEFCRGSQQFERIHDQSVLQIDRGS